jgi:hypothetical protein
VEIGCRRLGIELPHHQAEAASSAVDNKNILVFLSGGKPRSTGAPAGIGLGMKPSKYLRTGDAVELGIETLRVSRQQGVAPQPPSFSQTR